MSSPFAIQVSNLSKRYEIYPAPRERLKQFVLPPLQQLMGRTQHQYFKEFWALKDVSFEVTKGETVGIIGRNGSGKSTLLQMIAGTLTPTAGAVQVNGRVAALLELGSGFNPEFSGRENVFMNGAILGLSQEEIAARFDEIAAFADIGEFIEQAVKTYSSGMLMRLAFAVSVCVDPDILIVDEALAVGDMAFMFKCMKRLEQLTQSGTTLLFVSHDIGAIKAFCQRAVYLTKGVAKASGSASDMVEMYLLDMRKEQQDGLEASQAAVTQKAAIGDAQQSIAFGTAQGHIRAASFSASGTSQYIFSSGDLIEISVEYEIDASVNRPAISLFVTDMRMIDLAGQFYWFNLPTQSLEGGMRQGSAVIRFKGKLNGGNYFVTLRLEERASATDFFPIDKQVGALSFTIQRKIDDQFLGLIDMDVEFTETKPLARR